MRRVYRRPPLSDAARAAYHRVHYAYAKWEFADRLLDVYEMCHADGIPFLAIIQPRRYCTLELDLDPAGFHMNAIEQSVVTLWADNALAKSPAPKRTQSVAVTDTGAVIRGLDFEAAQFLAKRIWLILASPASEVPA